MADRVLVVCEGRITADIAREDATPEAVMHAATHSAAQIEAAQMETAR
jgi:rhamnose transport system ATP-binding protein